MSTRNLAFGGVMCALCSVCIITSTLFHLTSPLVIACVLFCLCAKKCGGTCAAIVIVASNLIGFFIGGIGAGEILFSVLLYSPLAIIVYATQKLNKSFVQLFLRASIMAVFSLAIYILFATALKELVSFDGNQFELGAYALGAAWTVGMTFFGFVMDKVVDVILKRFVKND